MKPNELEDKDANILKLAQTRYNEGKGFFLAYNRERFQRYLRNYKNDGQKRLKEKIQKFGNEDWMSNLFYPLTSSYIDSVVPIIKENLPTLGVRPARPEAIENAKKVNQYFNSYLTNKMGFQSVMGKISRTATIFGVAYPIHRWFSKYDIVFEYKNGEPSAPTGKIDESSYLEYNDPLIENGDVFSVFPDGYATSPETRRYVIVRSLITHEEAMARYVGLFKSGLITGNIEEIFKKIKVGTGDLTDYSDVRFDSLRKNPERGMSTKTGESIATGGQATGYSLDPSIDKSEFIEVQTKQDITIYCGQTLIGQFKNPFKEIWVDHITYKEPEYGIWGIGIGEELDIAQYYINVCINQESDVATLENFPMYTYDPGVGYQGLDDNMTISPSKIIPIAPNSIGVLPRGGTLNLSYKLMEVLKVAAREATNIDETTRGSQLPSSTVATQINAIRESTNRRVNDFLAQISEYEARLMRFILKQGYLLYPIVKGKNELGEEVDYLDLYISTGELNKEEFFQIEKEAFSPKGLYRYSPSMIKAIEFSREAELRNAIDFIGELNRLLANDTIAKQLANLNIEPVLKTIFEKFGVEYSRPEGSDSIQDVKVIDTVVPQLTGGEVIPPPNELSQLPEPNPMDMGQNLSVINQ